MHRKSILMALILVLGLALSCSGTGSAVAPDLDTTVSSRSSGTNNTCLWGLWEVSLDPVSSTADILPLRQAEFTANVTQFLQPPFSKTNLMGIEIKPETDFPSGYVVVDVIFTHPFPGLDTYTGFDVRGVCIGNGSIGGIADGGILYAGPDDVQVLNPDGLTRWFNPSEFTTYEKIFGFTLGKLGTPSFDFTATLNAYKYYCDELGPEDDVAEFFADPGCLNPRGLFSAGNTLRREYELQFPVVGGSPELRFQYAVIASWNPPDPDPPVLIPDDFPLSANCQEAYCLSAMDQSDMYYLGPGDNGGMLRMLLKVFDHQGAGSPSGVAPEIAAIHLETPGGLITTGGLATFDPAALSGALYGYSEGSVTYLLEVEEVEPYGVGEFPVLVVVENADPSDYDSGFPGFAYPEGALASYLLTNVSVGADVQKFAPVAVAEVVTDPPYCPDDPIEFDASGSYDPDGGSIVSYEWDFDGDGTYGDAYDSGTDENPVKIFPDFGVFEVDLRVTDDEAESDTLDEPLTLGIGGATWVDDDAVPPYDGSFDNPWPTIQQGIDNADMSCGQGWVLVKDGTYEEYVTMRSNIVVEGYSTPAPLITTPEPSTANMVTFGSSTNSTIKHFRAQPRTTGYGIYLGSTSNNLVDDIEFLDNPGGDTCRTAVGASSWGGTNLTVNNVRCDGYHKSATGFIYVAGAGATITNCVVLNLTFTAASSMNVIRAYQGGAAALVAKNVIGHITFSQPFVSTQWATAMSIDYCEGSTVRNNLIFDIDNNLGDTGWTWGIDSGDALNMTFEHNTISGISGPAWIYALETTDYYQDPSGVTHRDHIIANLTAGMMNWRWAYLGRWGSNLPVDYSCAYNVGTPFRDQVVAGVGVIYLNPQFMNPAGDDYRVSSGSPCHNSAHDGTDMGAYGGSDPLTWLP